MARRQQTTLLPPPLKNFLYHRYQEILGCGLFGVGFYMALALISYDPTDPSLNTAVDGDVRNLAGFYGSFLADILMQLFGGASLCLAGMFLAWGRLKLFHQPLSSLTLRSSSAILASLLLAVFLATLGGTTNAVDLIPAGGSLGALIVTWLHQQQWLGSFALPRLVIALVSLVISLFLLFYAYDVKKDGLTSLAISVAKGLQTVLQIFRAPLLFRWSLLTFPDTPTPAERAKRARIEPALGKNPATLAEELLDNQEDTLFTTPVREIEGKTPEPVGPVPLLQTRPRKEDALEAYRSLSLDEHVEYHLPPLTLLSSGNTGEQAETVDKQSLERNAGLLKSVLEEFGIRGEITKIRPGPVVTLYELVPAPGIKTSRVISLADDIARSMSAISARVAVIAGQNAIGIELPNHKRQSVFLREMLSSSVYERTGGALPLILGKDIGGAPVIADLARMPHLLVAGTTGSGKSVGINSMILSLLFRLSPQQCKLIMIDPKMLELSIYDGIPHLLTPVVTDPKKAVVALKWTVREMEERYRAMSKVGVRNIEGYNLRLRQAEDTGEALTRRVQTGFDAETGKPVFETQALDLQPLPYIVVVVDEMADLMLVAGKDIEAAVQRLAQMARAAGIHLIMATQRPSVDVITGTIKANFPTRISFQVTSKIDSRTILGEQGAEQLLGQGDMLYMAAGGRITRVHGPFVSDTEVEHVVQFLSMQGSPVYIDSITEETEAHDEGFSNGSSAEEGLYQQAVSLILRERKASTSFVQRHLQIGYNRAARLIEQMEKEGIVSVANHVGKREILRDA